jgi:hypothetical protein
VVQDEVETYLGQRFVTITGSPTQDPNAPSAINSILCN